MKNSPSQKGSKWQKSWRLDLLCPGSRTGRGTKIVISNLESEITITSITSNKVVLMERKSKYGILKWPLPKNICGRSIKACH